ncbi:MAG TPA: N-acetylmuramoyl-L-alanine amidase [Thermoanaerobaculia bacterium]|jgi:N-acetylmuramoyl-L-alanine amidase|nr:N-acetylmuramoyl-L-alanine amidase [Thermoanaerobaculia bacterium]
MANVDRIKRQLLRDLVQQNVDLIHGRPTPRRERRREGWRLAARVASLAFLSVALFGSSRLISTLNVPRLAGVSGSAMAAAGVPAVPAVTLSVPPKPVAAAVFPLAVRKIVVDAGHGGSSLGTRTPQGLVEKELTLDIAERLRRLLEKDAFQVVMTREADRDVSLEQRGALANKAGADIFVSIHLNWIENRSRGVETYYLGPTDDPYLTRLAASENRESGYSMADMRHLLDRIYAGVRQEKSRKLAETVQGSLFESLGKVSPEIEDRGVKAAPFIVLLTTEMPAILAEVSSVSNEEEARLLTKPLYRQYIAEALAQGIRAYAKAVEGGPETSPEIAAVEKGSNR